MDGVNLPTQNARLPDDSGNYRYLLEAKMKFQLPAGYKAAV